MRKHNKTYENVFSSDHEGSTSPFNIEKVSVEGFDIDTYITTFSNFLKEFYDDLFLKCVRLSWLRRKFCYFGTKPIVPFFHNGRKIQENLTKFIRRIVGRDIQIITKGYFFSRLETHYFNTFFPYFLDENPFENPEMYKFPYENISMDFLILVYQLDDRFDLLEEANKNKMTYAVFIDYVINHILSENDFLGRDRYTLVQGACGNRNFPYVFKDGDKNFKSQKGEKRI